MGLDNIFKKGTSGQISSEVSVAIEPKNTKKDWYQRGVDAAGLATGNSDVYGSGYLCAGLCEYYLFAGHVPA